MDVLAADEYYSLADEKFDFDMSLSPASSRGEEEQEEDEVFGGSPSRSEAGVNVGTKPTLSSGVSGGSPSRSEAGVNVGTKPTLSSGVSGGEEPSWSPLLGDSFESICKEAHSLAIRLENRQQEEVGGGGGGGGGETSVQSGPVPPDPPVEQFVQEPRDKLGLLSLPRPSTPLSPIKRETFCVRDSPLKLLPPALQTRPLPHTAARPRTRLSTSSPARTQTRMSLRGKTGLGVLPNRPPAHPSTLSSTQRSGPVDRPGRLAPPGKGALGLRRGSSRGDSCEDLLSDTASVASDASDCSLDSSMQGRRGRAPPPGKAPPTSTRKGVETRRHTSSSSLSSSLSVSPTGKPSSSLMNPGSTRTRRSGMLAAEPPAAPPTSTTAGARRSVSTQLRRPSEVRARPPSVGRSTPVKRAEPGTPLALTPAKRLMENPSSSRPSLSSSSRPSLSSSSRPSLSSSSRPSLTPSSRPSLSSSSRPSLTPSSRPSLSSSSRLSLVSSKPQQQPGSRVKPRAPVAPTHLRRLAGPEGLSSPDAPRIINPKRLLSTCSVDSLPQREVELPSTPSSTCGAALQWRPQRSALPTPSGRRLSFIPTMTPRSLSRTAPPGTPSCAPPGGAPEQAEEEQQCFASVIQPFSLEEEESAPGLDGPPSPPPTTKGPGEPIQEDQKMEGNQEKEEYQEKEEEKENQTDLMELQSAEDLSTTQHNKNQEVMEFLLVDVPAPVGRLDEKLLIDLSNTPDLVRTNPSKPCGGQLIDLSSPLIKWSPEEKQGNTGILVNISF